MPSSLFEIVGGHNTGQAGPDYGPFVFDIALLGYQVCQPFQVPKISLFVHQRMAYICSTLAFDTLCALSCTFF